MTCIKNPFNYQGSKNRIMDLVQENLPTNVHNIVEPFAGTFEVSLNSPILNKFYNDSNPYIYGLVETLASMEYDELLNALETEIDFFGLSKTNKQGFLELRREFNTLGCKFLSDPDPYVRHLSFVQLLALVYHSFNYQFTFTKDGRFSVPSGCGRSWFNGSLKKKLEKYVEALKNSTIYMRNLDFREFLNIYTTSMGNELGDTVFFVDPPYLVSDDVYSRTSGHKWTSKDLLDLYKWLERIDELGGKWVYTDQVKKGEITNEHLLTFSKRYVTINTNATFKGCSYQHKRGNDLEVLVKNF